MLLPSHRIGPELSSQPPTAAVPSVQPSGELHLLHEAAPAPPAGTSASQGAGFLIPKSQPPTAGFV